MVKEKIGNTKLDKKILDADFKIEEIKDFKKSNTIEDAKVNSKPLLKAIQQRESEISKADKEKQLTKDIKKFTKFEKDSAGGVNSNNPIHSTLAGNDLSKNGKHGEAIKQYEKAEKQDPVFCVPAKYNTVMAIVEQNKNAPLDQSRKDQMLNKLKEASKLVKESLIPQVQSNILQHGVSNQGKMQQVNSDDFVKQQESKIKNLEVISNNIERNIQLIDACPTDGKHMVQPENTRRLSSILSDSKEEKKAAEEYEEAGLKDIVDLKIVKKPKKQGFWAKFGVIVLGAIQVAVGYLLTYST